MSSNIFLLLFYLISKYTSIPAVTRWLSKVWTFDRQVKILIFARGKILKNRELTFRFEIILAYEWRFFVRNLPTAATNSVLSA